MAEGVLAKFDSLICDLDTLAWFVAWTELLTNIATLAAEKKLRPSTLCGLVSSMLSKRGIEFVSEDAAHAGDGNGGAEEVADKDVTDPIIPFSAVLSHSADASAIRNSFKASETYEKSLHNNLPVIKLRFIDAAIIKLLCLAVESFVYSMAFPAESAVPDCVCNGGMFSAIVSVGALEVQRASRYCYHQFACSSSNANEKTHVVCTELSFMAQVLDKFFIDMTSVKLTCLCKRPLSKSSDTLYFAGPVLPVKVASITAVRLCTVEFIPDADVDEMTDENDETCSFGLYMSGTSVDTLSSTCPVLPWMLPTASADKSNMNVHFENFKLPIHSFASLLANVEGEPNVSLPYLSPCASLTEDATASGERVQVFRAALPGESVGPVNGKKRKLASTVAPVQLPPDIAQFVGVNPAVVAAKSTKTPAATAVAKGKAKAKAKVKAKAGDAAAAHLLR